MNFRPIAKNTREVLRLRETVCIHGIGREASAPETRQGKQSGCVAAPLDRTWLNDAFGRAAESSKICNAPNPNCDDSDMATV